MAGDEALTIRIELGLSVEKKPTLRQIHERAQLKLEVVASGQKALQYLNVTQTAFDSPIDASDGTYVLVTPIPVTNRQFGIVKPARKPRRGELVTRADDEEQEVIDETLVAVKHSAETIRNVATAMNTLSGPALIDEMRKMEVTQSIDTEPARRFVSRKQGDFEVMVAHEAPIVFESPVVRTAVQSSEPVRLTLGLRDSSDVKVINAEVIKRAGVHETGKAARANDTFKAERVYDFRFGKLLPWQWALLEAARILGFQVEVLATQVISTCTLGDLPADVGQVLNWEALRAAVVNELLAERTDETKRERA